MVGKHQPCAETGLKRRSVECIADFFVVLWPKTASATLYCCQRDIMTIQLLQCKVGMATGQNGLRVEIIHMCLMV